MRCAKCGYISFDHLDKCPKCRKDIETNSSNPQGSVSNIKGPSFLVGDVGQQGESLGKEYSAEARLDTDMGPVNTNLEIDPGFSEENMGLDDIERDGIDFNQPEDDYDTKDLPIDEVKGGGEEGLLAAPSINVEIPKELLDISDLASPMAVDGSNGGLEDSDGLARLNMDDDLNFDLDLSEVPHLRAKILQRGEEPE